MAGRHKLIVGIDYGTTSTGISFVNSLMDGLADVEMITSWPGANRPVGYDWKTPSRIAYVKDNPKAHLESDLFGFEVEPGMVSQFWTKLLLDKSASTKEHDDPSLTSVLGQNWQKLPAGKSAKNVVQDYLAEVYKYLVKVMEQRYTAETLKLTPMEFWVTMPAIWSDAAQSATREAAMNAGFGSRPMDELYMITEPEAAALAALKEESTETSLNPIKPGENVLICDCGGGTVDITTYNIVSAEPLRFDEVLVGTGGKCGSTYIDRNFHQLMLKRFGEGFSNIPEKLKAPGSVLMNSFESVKRSFGWSEGGRPVKIGPIRMNGVQDSEYFDADDDNIILTRADLKSLFDPVMKEIIGLVTSQATLAAKKNHPLNRVILVGGFGDSPYLNKALKVFCDQQAISLMCPSHSQAAIARGAALRGLEGRPGSNQCRRNYGICASRPFRESIDDEEDAWINAFNGLKLCSGVMTWQLRKDETITADTSCSVNMSIQGEVDDSPILVESLYASDADVPGERERSPDVKLIASIIVDFSDVDLSTFRSTWKNGKKITALDVELKIDYGAKEGVLQFSSWVKGKRSGFATVRYP